MLFLLSPAKSLNFDAKITAKKFSTPNFLDDSKILIDELKKFSPEKISALMDVSPKLAQLNFERYHNFATPFNEKNSKPAIFVFDGDVYDAIDAQNYSQKNLEFAQNSMRILSGLYGILKPLDLMQPYRLEMSTSLKNKRGKNLYEFWGDKISEFLNKELTQNNSKIILNLASEEYFKAINLEKIDGKIINIIFKEHKNNSYKIIGLFAKRARGMMADYIIKNNITKIEDIKKFNVDSYKFRKDFSDETNFVFCR